MGNLDLAITMETIPTWLVAITMIVTGAVWLFSRRMQVRLDSRIFGGTFILWGIMYGFLFINFPEAAWLPQFHIIPIGVKVFYLKLMLLMVCFSQYIPLLISLIRSIRRNEHI
jgi:hypothetical protein